MQFRPLSMLVAALAGHSITFVSAVPAPAAQNDPVADSKILDLTPKNFAETVAKDHWFIKFYSPTCPACIESAPAWQAVADYYSAPNFAEDYKVHYANLNCQAYGDLCTDLDIKRTPTFRAYNAGKVASTLEGKQTIEKLVEFTEERLKAIKPGSRPANPPTFSQVRDNEEEKREDVEAKVEVKPEEKSEEKSEEKPKPVAAAAAAPTTTPNPRGRSEPLDAESFQAKVLNSRDGWFVKFYAPWCGHCQAMAPAWSQLGKDMQNQLNIGEVNCDLNKALCKDVGLKGYPTIIYFQNGQKVEYDGLRGLGDLVTFARHAVDSAVKDIDAAGLAALENDTDNQVAFIYFYDEATATEDFESLSRLTLNLIGRAPLFKSNDPELYTRFRVYNKPKLMVLREGRPTYYPAIAPHEFRDNRRVLDWMRKVWLPIVPELTAANSRELMNNRYVVLGVLDRSETEKFEAAKKELKEAAVEFMDKRVQEENQERKELRDKKQLRLEEARDRNDDRGIRAAKKTRVEVRPKKDVGFAWVDGVFWERWIKSTYGINVHEDGERIIINDEENKRYWDVHGDGRAITPSRTQILDALENILTSPPKIKSKSSRSGFEGAYHRARNAFAENMMKWILVMVFVTAAAAVVVRMKTRGRGGFLRLDGGKEGGGLLGGNGGGKVD